jgi:hypothetical protein
MATEVKHGPSPTFDHQITGAPYGLTIVSHYTTTPDLAAGGVTTCAYASERDVKRRAELLNLRTIFLHWWLTQWTAQNGDLREGAAHVAAGLQDTAVKRSGGRA